MPSDTVSSNPKIKEQWLKVKRTTGLYQYIPNGVYHARVCHGGRLYRESLQTKDLAFAKLSPVLTPSRTGGLSPNT